MKLYELIYTSSSSSQDPDIESILGTCLLANACHGITGCLIWDSISQTFTQLIEGEKASILQLYRNIIYGERHFNVVVVHEGRVAKRSFPQWSMRYVDRKKINLGNEASSKDVVAYLAQNQGQRVFDRIAEDIKTEEMGRTDEIVNV